MTSLCNEKRKNLLELLDIAEQRFGKLKQTVTNAKGEFAGMDIRLAIDDAITPLRIAFEDAQDI